MSSGALKILIIFGTRPEAIKMAPLYWAFKNYPDKFDVRICITRQHQIMLDQVLEDFDLKPDYEIHMPSGLSLGEMTGHLIRESQAIFEKAQPHICFVHGDTTTSFACSLASFYSRIDVAHVEAGLRTHNHYSPWPEELNRQLTGRIAKYHFAPTELSLQNLHKENLNWKNAIVTGNTVIDALFWILTKIRKNSELQSKIVHLISNAGYTFTNRKIVLITSHRRENHGDNLNSICKAINALAAKYTHFDFIYPVHLNPKVKDPVHEQLGHIKNVFLLPPLPYMPFVYLLSKSHLILTDSGGIQEEAPSLNVPVLVLRDTSERPEAISSGAVRLIGTQYEQIIHNTSEILDNPSIYNKMQNTTSPYGNGEASQKIVHYFLQNKT